MGDEAAAARADPRVRATTDARALEVGEIAWLAVVPCALLTAVLVFALGPPLGSLLFPPSHARFWPTVSRHPEPTEEARYLLSLLAPLLACAVVVASVRHGRMLRTGRAHSVFVRGVQLLALVLLAAALVRQHHPYFDIQVKHPYFSWVAVVVATAFAGAIGVVASGERTRVRAVGLLRETSARRRVCLGLAVVYSVVWLLTAVNTDGSIGNANYAVVGLLPWTADDAYAVVNGLSPLVDYHAVYGSLFSYLSAVPLAVFHSSLLAFMVFMAAVSSLALVAVYDVLRRVTRSSVGALALFGPVVAIGFYTVIGSHQHVFSAANDFRWFPLRMAGPYLLAWLVVRHLDGARPRRVWPLFAAGGLVALNNPDFGLVAVVAVFAALAWTWSSRDRRALRIASIELVAGLALAYALVAAVTLARAGSLPHLEYLTEYTSLFVRGGLNLQPMPGFGFHCVLYATYAAALVLATVRAVGGRRDVLTGMLAWSGVFGFGSAGHWVGESGYQGLIFLFSPWALALALLLVAGLGGIAARNAHRPTPADVAVLIAFGLAVCALAQTPAPWTQLQRITSNTPTPVWLHPPYERLVAITARRGEHVAILAAMGHRIASDLGLVNVAPYSNEDLVQTGEQLDTVIRALRTAHGRRLYCLDQCRAFEQQLTRAGFKRVRDDPAVSLIEFVDQERAHP